MKSKLIECGICKWEYLPKAHGHHCPVCGSFPISVGDKQFHIDLNTNRQIARPFSVTRSLAEVLNALAAQLKQ